MQTEALIRLAAFLGVLGLMALWEVLAPRRRLATSKLSRWVANLSVAALNTLLLRAVVATGAVGAATVTTAQHWGACTN